jgi:hypothetical protein
VHASVPAGCMRPRPRGPVTCGGFGGAEPRAPQRRWRGAEAAAVAQARSRGRRSGADAELRAPQQQRWRWDAPPPPPPPASCTLTMHPCSAPPTGRYTCDAFGMHYCSEEPFDVDVPAILPHYRCG